MSTFPAPHGCVDPPIPQAPPTILIQVVACCRTYL
jgi:hypothetical protein